MVAPQNSTPKSLAARSERNRKRRTAVWLGLGILAVMVAAISYIVVGRMKAQQKPAEANPDFSTTRLSDRGMFRASYRSRVEPIPTNELHIWTLHLETPAGKPLENAEILVDGLMPEHGHGLPTQPRVTNDLGHGDYVVEGMKFQMSGWWRVNFHIRADGRNDKVTFNLSLH